MALSNAQYDEIMRNYQKQQLHNRYLTDKRREEIYAKEPRIKQVSDSIAAASVAFAKKKLDGENASLDSLRTQISKLRAEKTALLQQIGYTDADLEPIYSCPDCRDTGYIGSQKCHCFLQATIDTVYSQSNIRTILEKENFSTFSYDYYANDPINPTTNRTPLENAVFAVSECHRFIDHFEQKPQNLFFYGDTGVGKTFLSNCVAKELLDAGKSVIYFTAFQLFDILSKGFFDKDADAIAAHQNIFDCDLLIIDDLGTELSNSFTTSQLFLCVNERLLRQKSTIISTNLNMSQMMDIYSERTFSRITSNYTLLKLFGDDIRIQKRQKG